MINVNHFRELIIRPVLTYLDLQSESFEMLVLGTALKESNLFHLKQLGNGPALGLYQMEKATHDDIHKNFLAFRGKLNSRVTDFASPHFDLFPQLAWNLHYSTAMCAVHYHRFVKDLPRAHDYEGLAKIWKAKYNTPLGKGHPSEFVDCLNECRIA